MLTHFRVQRYKSLFDVAVDFEPLTVFIGPNGSGKSNICEALLVLSRLLKRIGHLGSEKNYEIELNKWHDVLLSLPNKPQIADKFWRGQINLGMEFEYKRDNSASSVQVSSKGVTVEMLQPFAESLRSVKVYNFVSTDMAQATSNGMESSGRGIANSLAQILFDDRDLFIEMEERFTALVPNISRISLTQDANHVNQLRLVDRYSTHKIPASDISDGTLRLFAFLVALYDVESPDIICFEEPENGVHPWLLNQVMELLNLVTKNGVRGKPIQVLITTHSPVLLNYVKPEQVRAVELDGKGRTQVRALPTDSVRFEKAMEAYDGELGELWFTNLIGGNP